MFKQDRIVRGCTAVQMRRAIYRVMLTSVLSLAIVLAGELAFTETAAVAQSKNANEIIKEFKKQRDAGCAGKITVVALFSFTGEPGDQWVVLNVACPDGTVLDGVALPEMRQEVLSIALAAISSGSPVNAIKNDSGILTVFALEASEKK